MLGVASVAGVLAARPLLGWGLRRWAEQRGVELAFGGLGLDAGRLILEGVEVRVRSLPRFRFSSARATFHVKQWTPERVHLEAPRVLFAGTPQEAEQELPRWQEGGALPQGLELSASGMTLVGQAPGGARPWLEVQGAEVAPLKAGGVRLSFQRLTAQGQSTGPFQVFAFPEAEGYELSFSESRGTLPFRIHAFLRRPQPGLRVELGRVALRDLAELGVPVPRELRRAEVEGVVESSLSVSSPVQGRVHLELRGYVPPHPPQVAPLLQGDRTTIDSEFRWSPGEGGALGSLALAPLAVHAGRLALKGSGSAALHPDHVTFRGTLHGALSCREVARSAARGADLGDLLGGVAAGLAGILSGEVRLSVQMEADSRTLDSSSFRTAVTPRCSVSF